MLLILACFNTGYEPAECSCSLQQLAAAAATGAAVAVADDQRDATKEVKGNKRGSALRSDFNQRCITSGVVGSHLPDCLITSSPWLHAPAPTSCPNASKSPILLQPLEPISFSQSLSRD